MTTQTATTINFTRGVPAIESFPIDEVIEASRAILSTQGAAMLQYGPSLGFQPLRQWLAEWQGVSVDRVLTGNGSLQLIEFLCLHMLKPGDTVLTEAPTYDRTITLLRRHGAKVIGIPIEADGPDVEALERALAKQVPKFFYTIPDFQNPAGVTCSGAKRRRIAELAGQYGFLIVEDAPYRLLRYRGKEEPTLYELAPERTLHMSSFTKLIAPGVRTGFMIGEPSLVARLAKVAEDTYISPGFVAQGITYEWCRRGLLLPQIERLKALYAPRLDACLAGLDKYLPDVRRHASRGRVLHLGHPPRGCARRPPCGRRPPAAPSTSRTASRSSRREGASGSCACRSARSRQRRSTRASGASPTAFRRHGVAGIR